MTRAAFLLPLLALAACAATDDTDAADAAAQTAAALPSGGKADDPLGVVGPAYEMTSPATYKAGDVTNLQFLGGDYVRGRCYHASCSTWAAETNKYDFTKSSGHTYVRFYSFKKDASTGTETPLVADVYEIRKTSTGIKLRKAYTSRWLTLATRTDEALCGESGGTWSNDTCDCGGQDPATGDWNRMAPGLGGCWLAPTGTEDSCDSTNGDYTDDDSTSIGTFCVCPIGTMVTDTGCEAI